MIATVVPIRANQIDHVRADIRRRIVTLVGDDLSSFVWEIMFRAPHPTNLFGIPVDPKWELVERLCCPSHDAALEYARRRLFELRDLPFFDALATSDDKSHVFFPPRPTIAMLRHASPEHAAEWLKDESKLCWYVPAETEPEETRP